MLHVCGFLCLQFQCFFLLIFNAMREQAENLHYKLHIKYNIIWEDIYIYIILYYIIYIWGVFNLPKIKSLSVCEGGKLSHTDVWVTNLYNSHLLQSHHFKSYHKVL